MEGTTAVEKHHPSHNPNHVSKSVGTLIQIGSISIDLVNANDVSNSGKCEHFTIRGYVSEMRKKDWKTVWPFPLDDNYEKSEEKMRLQLPSLSVPKSRWWRCRNCLCAENIFANTNGSVLKCCSVKFNLSANMNNKDCCQYSQPVEQKEEKIEAVNNTNEGDENDTEVNRDREISVSIAAGAICMKQTAEAVKANCDESATEDAVKKHSGRYPSMEVDKNTYASPNKSASSPDKSAGLSRKRNRKSCLITELLAEKGDVIRKENSPHISISNASAEASVPSSFLARLSIQEELPSAASKNRNMKRKFTLADGWRPLEMCPTSHVPKKTVSSGGNTDTIVSSGSEEHAGARVRSVAHSNNNRIEKSPAMGKKRQKTNTIFHERSSVEPFLENMRRESHQQIEVGNKDNVSFKQGGYVGLTDKGNGRLNFPALKMDQILCKKINNMHQDDRQALLTHWNNYNILRDSPNTVRDKHNMQNESIAIPFQSVQNAHPDQGLNHSLSYMAMQRRNIESGPQFMGWSASLTSLQKGISEEGLIKRNDVNMSFTPGSCNQGELEAYFQRAAFCCDLNNKKTSNNYPFLNVKRKNVSQIEGRYCMYSAETSNKGAAIEIRENSSPSRKFNERRAESAEVMEIAELMAKNQYDRCLPGADNNKEQANNARGAQILDLNEAYIGGDSSLLQDNNSERRKYQKNGGNGNIKIGENPGNTKEKTFDYLSNLSTSHLGQTYTSSGFRPFPQYQEKPSSGVQLFPSRQVTGQNIQCTGNVFGQSSSHAGLVPPGRIYSNTEGTPPLAEALTRFWPSMYPNHGPYGYNIAQNHADHYKDVLSHCQGNLTKGNLIGNRNSSFLNPNGCSFDDKGGNTVSEALYKTQAEHSKRGLHSIDALSAMHLLSLVDTNLPIGPTVVDANGSTRLLHRPPFPYHNLKEFPVLPSTNDNNGKTHISQNSNECFPTITTASASTFPFEHGKSGSNFVNQVSPKSRGRGKAKVSDSPTLNRQHPALVSGGLGTIHGSLPGHCGSSSMLFPALGDGNTQKIADPRTSDTLKSIVQCSLNRNPADFSIPESGNDYMIAGEDLKFRSQCGSDNRAGLIKPDGQKQPTKTSVPKKPGWRQVP